MTWQIYEYEDRNDTYTISCTVCGYFHRVTDTYLRGYGYNVVVTEQCHNCRAVDMLPHRDDFYRFRHERYAQVNRFVWDEANYNPDTHEYTITPTDIENIQRRDVGVGGYIGRRHEPYVDEWRQWTPYENAPRPEPQGANNTVNVTIAAQEIANLRQEFERVAYGMSENASKLKEFEEKAVEKIEFF